MGDTQRFNVISRGEIEQGFESQEVIKAFAALFQIPVKEAAAYVSSKKLIGNQLSSEDAAVYQDQIASVGLLTDVVAKVAANDPESIHPHKKAKPPSPECQAIGSDATPETSAPQVICPKCNTMQQKSEFCGTCSLVFSKYVDPAYHKKAASNPDAATDSNEVSDAGKPAKKFLILMMCVVAIGLMSRLIGSIATDGISGSKSTVFIQQSTAGEKINQLMEVAQLGAIFSNMDEELELLFHEQLSFDVKEWGGSPESTAYIINSVPGAYNQTAASIGLANWLQLSLRESEIDALIDDYSTVVIQNFSKFVSADLADTEAQEMFLANYDKKPMQPGRRRALEKIVDILSLDDTGLLIFAEGAIARVRLAASTSPDFNTNAGRSEVDRKIREVTGMAPIAMPYIREEMIKNLAWSLNHYTVFELQKTARALNTPEIRKLYKELGHGMKDSVEKATYWLMIRSEQHAKSLPGSV